jgi:hypothetical protein
MNLWAFDACGWFTQPVAESFQEKAECLLAGAVDGLS